MRTKQKVIGRTGEGAVLLSDGAIRYKLVQKRTVRYRYVKCQHGYRAEVVGPFHSALYGTGSFGTKRSSAKAALQRNLANNHGYIGHIMFSDIDDADNVGKVNRRLLDENATARPVTLHDTCALTGR